MLVELRVRDLGVIDDLHLVLGPGMTALTGETGAGKTLVVGAIDLLIGGRAEGIMVRPGADEAVVEGRFVTFDGRELVVSRVVPSGGGRSRAYVDGRMSTAAALAELGAELVDLHGQHAHQSLLQPAVQRAALDAFGAIDTTAHDTALDHLRAIERELGPLGGDARARLREMDLLRFQLDEIDAAALTGPDEDAELEVEEDLLRQASAHRAAALAAVDALTGDSGADESLGVAYTLIRDRAPLVELARRAQGLQAEAEALASELREAAESIVDDPARLQEVHERRRLLHDLRRKYGDTLEEVIAFSVSTRERLDVLASHDLRVVELEADRSAATDEVTAAAAAVAAARRIHAPRLAAAIEARLSELAMPKARVGVTVGDADPGDDVCVLIAANPGEPLLPLVKVASGGELARTMLAARLVLTGGPPTLVFDEVDAGIGGTAALAVGRSLSKVAADHQVLVVTHLPQVAAFADAQVAVAKGEQSGRTIARAQLLDDGERVIELSRMLSGQPESDAARGHAEELLTAAARERGR